MERKNILSLIVTIFFFVAMITSATYSYFATTRNSSYQSFNTILPERAVLTSYSTDPIALNIESEDFNNASTTPVETDNGNIIVDLIANSNGSSPLFCTYDIRLVWDTNDQYTSPSVTLPYNEYSYELSIVGSRVNNDTTSGHSYQTKQLSETNLTNLSWTGSVGNIGRYATLITGAEIYNKSASTHTITTWTFTMKFYVLPVSQDSFSNKSMSAHLEIANIVC